MNQRPAETIPDTPSAAARRVIELARMAAGVYGRPDLEGTIAIALARIDRPETLIAVIGEFKKGKSSLINALLGADIAPVDDDLATAVTSLYRHGEQPFATVLSTEDGKDIQRTVPLEEALALVREQENPGNARGIRAVEFHISNEFLKTGAVLIDTPGFGGLALSGEGVSRVLLRAVHAVVMVADASMPLSRPELDIIIKAATACPAILLAVSKTDLYPSWRNIVADDEATLAAAGLDLPVLPLSSALMGHALRRQDDALAAESGVPALRDSMESLIMETSRAAECLRGLAEARSAIGQISESARHELAALEAPEGAARQAAELEAARANIEHLRGRKSGGRRLPLRDARKAGRQR